MEVSIPVGTVRCLLCRGLVIYKNGDKSRFVSHLQNEHGAFFDTDYLLASSLMNDDQKVKVAKTVKVIQDNETVDYMSSLRNGPGQLTPIPTLQFPPSLSVSQIPTPGPSSHFVCGSCSAPFAMREDYVEHLTSGCNKTTDDTQGDIFKEDAGKRIFDHSDQLGYTPSVKREKIDAENQEFNMPKRSDFEDLDTSETVFGSINDVDQNLMQSSNDDQASSTEAQSQDLSTHTIGASYDGTPVSKQPKKFVCTFPPCPKSFSAKTSLSVHERKFHDRPLLKKGRKTKIDGNVDDGIKNEIEPFQSEECELPQSDSGSLNSNDLDSLYETKENPETTLEEADAEPSENQLNSSVMTDTSLIFNESLASEVEESQVFDDGDATESRSENLTSETDDLMSESGNKLSVDISKSKYFIKNPKVIANARGKSIKLFDEEASDLPMGWKMRSIEVKSNTTGTTNTIKHYLSPECKVLKTGLSVVEYLRLEGMLSTDKIIEIAQKLNVSEKKLRNLFSSAAE